MLTDTRYSAVLWRQSRGRSQGGRVNSARATVSVANIQVMRFKTKAKLGAQVHLVRHIQGKTRPVSARDSAVVSVHASVEVSLIVNLDGVGMPAAREGLDTALAARPKRGRPPNECVEFLFAGPPPYGPGEWSKDRELEWAREVRASLRKLIGPNSIIVTLDLHRDETSPHVQGVVIPIDSNGKLGWCGVRDEAVKRMRPEVLEGHAAASVWLEERRATGEVLEDLPALSDKRQYGVIQDWLYYGVSRQFGLGRGVPGSEATHEAIDRKKGAENAERRAKDEAERAGDEAKRFAELKGWREEESSTYLGTSMEVSAKLDVDRDELLDVERNLRLHKAELARTEQRCEEANAVAAAAIERREREEKAGWRRFRSAGRVLLDAESERDAAKLRESKVTKERDRYRDQLDDRKRELEERTKERDKARSEGSKLGESARTAAQEHGKEREAARVAGRADGRREAGAALDRILSGAQGLLERVPVLGQRLGRLVAALRSGDADEVVAASPATAPADRAPRTRSEAVPRDDRER